MSRRRSNDQQPAGQGRRGTSRPKSGARSIRTVSLLLLVGVVLMVALQMVVSCVGFVLDPDPAVEAGPMYVTLALTTGAALLMLVMALNASFLPFVSRRQAPNVYLVMGAMGITGVVTGLLTVGGEVSRIATRLVLAAIALTFVTVQNARLARAQEAAPAGRRLRLPRGRSLTPRADNGAEGANADQVRGERRRLLDAGRVGLPGSCDAPPSRSRGPRPDRPSFVLQGNICALLAARDHVDVFLL
jgi:hypothetical protein